MVEILERAHAQLGRPPIVIAATDENAATASQRLGQEAASAVIGELANVRDLGEAELLDQLTAIASAHDEHRERDLLERRAAQIGRREVGDSLDEVLAAISDGRAETLLIARGADAEVCSCPQCGRLSDHAQVCPVDGSFIQRDHEGIEVAVAETIARGGDIRELGDADRRDLDAGDGLGVIVRF